MHANYITKTMPDRQLKALHHNLAEADNRYMAHFETPVSKLWGIDERIFRADNGVIPAELTLILSLKDRRTRYDKDTIKALVRGELKALVDYDGEWSKGPRPDVFGYEDVEVTGFEVILLSRSQWIVKVDLQAQYESNTMPLGFWEYWSERGVR